MPSAFSHHMTSGLVAFSRFACHSSGVAPPWRKIFRVFTWDNGYIFSVDKNIFPAVGVLSTKDERSTQMSNEFPITVQFRPVYTRDLLFF